jgi:hypothetical protein
MGFNPGILGAADALSNLILVSPVKPVGYQAQSAPVTPGLPTTDFQAPSFVFDYEAENTISLQSDITDHYIEDNTSIQDQISLKPEIITVRGYIGELNDITPAGFGGAAGLLSKLTTVSAFVPGLSATATNIFNKSTQIVATANKLVDSAVSAWNSLTGGSSDPVQNKQQIAYGQFYGYRQTRTLFTVQTPWALYQNCAIQSLLVTQDAESNVVSDFEISFKVLRFATTLTVSSGSLQGRANQSNSLLSNLGVSVPSVPSVSPPGLGSLTGGHLP